MFESPTLVILVLGPQCNARAGRSGLPELLQRPITTEKRGDGAHCVFYERGYRRWADFHDVQESEREKGAERQQYPGWNLGLRFIRHLPCPQSYILQRPQASCTQVEWFGEKDKSLSFELERKSESCHL